MSDLTDAKLAELFKRFVEHERLNVTPAAAGSQGEAASDTERLEIVQEVELHKYAVVVVDEAVAKYRANLYHLARQLASEQLDSGVVTRAHVRQAQAMMARPRHRYSWDDALLGLGGLLLGCALPHVIDLFQHGGKGNPLLIAGGIVGALLFGMGMLAKARL